MRKPKSIKTKTIKTQEERRDIVEKLKERFHNVTGINIDTFEAAGVAQFREILHEYSTIPHLIGGFSGKIYVEEMGRYIEYILPVRSSTQEHVALVVK